MSRSGYYRRSALMHATSPSLESISASCCAQLRPASSILWAMEESPLACVWARRLEGKG